MRMAAGSRSGDLFLGTGFHRGGLSFVWFYDYLNGRRPREYLLTERAIDAQYHYVKYIRYNYYYFIDSYEHAISPVMNKIYLKHVYILLLS